MEMFAVPVEGPYSAVLRDANEAVRDTLLVTATPRSPGWNAVREAFVKKNPSCTVCGGTAGLNVHHIRPFHLFPDLELDPDNLITLCECGPGRMNCHLLVGHGGNWRDYNPKVRSSSKMILKMIEGRVTA